MAKIKDHRYVALYERLSHDDELQGKSSSISNQKRILEDYALSHGMTSFRHYTDMYNQRLIQRNTVVRTA